MSEHEKKKVGLAHSDTPKEGRGEDGKAVQEHAPSQPVSVSESEAANAALGQVPQQPESLEEALKEAADNRDRWLRAAAELENFRKRTAQEKNRLLKYKNEELLRDLLTIADNMERAEAFCNEESGEDSLSDGVRMITRMFRDVLEKYGVTEIKAIGEPFDPNFQEAVARVPSPTEQPGHVMEVLEKGYLYHDRLLRAAKVVVADEPRQVH